jgi:Sec7-like guanine-nucleotide exchange factor
MLHTEHHSPNMGSHTPMTQQNFINMNRGVNNGQNFDKTLLEQIYTSIKSTPFTWY